MFMLKYEGDHNFEGNRFNTISPSLTFRLGNHVYLSGQLDYAWNTDEMQYVATTSPLSSSSLALIIMSWATWIRRPMASR